MVLIMHFLNLLVLTENMKSDLVRSYMKKDVDFDVDRKQ